ncbi:MAG: hypothetical protein IKZ44_07450 [Clostridia bacterium]|nr:hypothetical protein [Clostridia bacterium]
MKRIVILCLVLALLIACVPTPEQEYIVNKGDSTIEDKINAAPQTSGIAEAESTNANASDGNAVQRQLFPERWDTDLIPVADRFGIRAQAEVETKADGLYPVYSTRSASFDRNWILRTLDTLLGKPTGSQEVVMTKADWGKELQKYLDKVEEHRQWEAAGKPDWGDRSEAGFSPEEIEEETDWYMEQIRNAPDEATAASASDFAGENLGKPKVYTMKSGEQAYVWASSDMIIVGKDCDAEPYVWYRYDVDFEESESKLWHDAAIDRTEADKTLANALKKLGLEDFTVRRVSEANLLAVVPSSFGDYVTSGWTYSLTRDFGGYPVSEIYYKASGRLAYDSGDEYVVNEPIAEEELIVLIDETGVRYFSYAHPKEVTGLKNANVELLSFEEVQDRIVKTLSVCYPYADYLNQHKTVNVSLEVVRLLLTTYTVRQKDASGYYEMPCWIVFFERRVEGPDVADDDTEDSFQAKSFKYPCLILNAIDGSPISPKQGY